MRPLALLITLLAIGACNSETSRIKSSTITEKKITNAAGFNIQVDTLDIGIDGYLTDVVLFDRKYYAIFADKNKKSTKVRRLFVFDENWNLTREIELPVEIKKTARYNMRVVNDRLLLNDMSIHETSFVFDKKTEQFDRADHKDYQISSDDDYNIYAMCNGEWGGTIYFENKKTKNVYEASSICPVRVNKIGTTYFVTNYLGHLMFSYNVKKIGDPSQLQKTQLDFKREIGSEFIKGTELLFDTAGFTFTIHTSFVKGKRLLHVYSDEQGIHIGEIADTMTMKPIYTFNFDFRTSFNQQFEDGTQLLRYYLTKSDETGILIINGSNFNFYVLRQEKILIAEQS